MSDKPEFDPYFDRFTKRFHSLPYIESQNLSKIVSAHLIAEHFVDELLAESYPGLPFRALRLTFEKKIKVIEPSLHPLMSEMIATLKVLGAIRNRIAHDLHASITQEDIGPLLAFMRKFPFPPDPKDASIAEHIGDYARYVAMLCDVTCITLKKYGPYGVEGFRRAPKIAVREQDS